MSERWTLARIEVFDGEVFDGLLRLIAETDAGAATNIGECRAMTLEEIEYLKISPADLLVESFKDERAREIARAFVRELRRFCR